MKKSVTTKLVALLLWLCALPLAANGEDVKTYWGEGTTLDGIIINSDASYKNQDIIVSDNNKTYTVYTAEGLAWIAKATNNGWVKDALNNTTQYYPTNAGFKECTIKLESKNNNKIDISKHYWTPIGKENKPFKGTFDGNKNEVTGLKIYESSNDQFIELGFFGELENASISNLGVKIGEEGLKGEGTDESSTVFIGSIAGYVSSSTIENCYIYGEESSMIEGNNINAVYIGGIVGNYQGYNTSINNCYSMIDITSTKNTDKYIGGIAGYNVGTIKSCYTTGAIICNGNNYTNYIGGIIGGNSGGTIKNNLALNKKIEITKEGNVQNINAARIGSSAGGTITSNYASPNLVIKGISITEGSNANGTTLTPNMKLSDLLKVEGEQNSGWTFPEDGSLPGLAAFDGVEQPSQNVKVEEVLYSSLVLDDNLAYRNYVHINYDSKDNQWYYEDNNEDKHIFNGKITGELKSSGLLITGGTDIDKTLPLTIVGEVKIKNEVDGLSDKGIEFNHSVNLSIENKGKLEISGMNGLCINTNSTLYISQSKSNGIEKDVKIKIEGLYEGILNYGTIRLEGETLDYSIKGADGIWNTGHCEIDGATVTVEGSENYYSILNTGSFSITNNSILNVINSKKDKQVFNNEGSSFTVAPGSCLARWTSMPLNPTYYTLTYTSPSEATLSVTDNDGSILESGAMTNAENDLIIQATSTTKDVDYYTFSWDNGSSTDTKSPDANGKCKYQMPASDLTISAVLKDKPVPVPDPEPDPDPNPIVYHTVTLPEVEGATTDPVAGNYEVESWDSFRFYLTLLPEYDQSQPIVTTDRGDVLSPRTSDGACVVKYVRSDVSISIDGIVKNPDPVANEIIREGLHISASGNRICIETDRSETAIIYNLMGQPVASFEVQPGMNYHWLAKGVYIVAVGDSRYKLSNN